MQIRITLEKHDIVSEFLTPPQPSAFDEERVYCFYLDNNLRCSLKSYFKNRREGKQRKYRETERWERFLQRDNTITKEKIIETLVKNNEYERLKKLVMEEINKLIKYEF